LRKENGALAGAVFSCANAAEDAFVFHPRTCVSTLLTELRKPWRGFRDA
jgi:hypothetical protein